MAIIITGNGTLIETALTSREREILALINQGLLVKEIAGMKYISIETVKKHLQNAYRKLGARNKIEALRFAGFIN